MLSRPKTLAGPFPIVEATQWRADHFDRATIDGGNRIALITAADVQPVLPGYDLWDLWPVQNEDGATTAFDGGPLWMILSAPFAEDPNARHGVARIRLMQERSDGWRDLGPFMPEGLCPGQREWAGTALYDPQKRRVTLYYTVAGRRSDQTVRFEQRLFEVSATLDLDDGQFTRRDWHAPHEIIIADNDHYMRVDGSESVPGFIKGFRDPAHFRDPADGARYMVFTASKPESWHNHNGVIGLAVRTHDGLWQTLPPLLDADGLNNELERPHLVFAHGQYYLFWSTQRHMFADEAHASPTGLYGAVASSMLGPYEILNGSGLVAANPESEPRQTYSWWVDQDLNVSGFVDHWGLNGRPHDSPETARAQFGGVPAPRFALLLTSKMAKIKR